MRERQRERRFIEHAAFPRTNKAFVGDRYRLLLQGSGSGKFEITVLGIITGISTSFHTQALIERILLNAF